MARWLFHITAVLALASCGARVQQVAAVPPLVDDKPIDLEYSPTTLIVLCDSTVGKAPLRRAIEQSGASIIYDYRIVCGMAIRKPDSMTLEQAMAYFGRVEGVISVERDRIHRLVEPVRPPTLRY